MGAGRILAGESRDVQKSLNRHGDKKKWSSEIPRRRFPPRVRGDRSWKRGNEENGDTPQFHPLLPVTPLYEFREQLGWDGATGLRLCES